MARKLSQKTIKVELEITVSMDEITEEALPEEDQAKELAHLQRLQQGLMADEAALQQLMLASALEKLHEYIDYLTTQDNLESLRYVAEKLAPEERNYFQKYRSDFFDLTRPLRRSSISVHLNKSEIDELVPEPAGASGWRMIWKDLVPTSQLSKNLANMSISLHSAPDIPCSQTSHFLISRHLTQQCDGVHFEARCTCNTVLEGVGVDEDQAVCDLWDRFRKHCNWRL
jgi:hypothetical protein